MCLRGTLCGTQLLSISSRQIYGYRIINPVAKITYSRVLFDCNIIIRVCRCRRDMKVPTIFMINTFLQPVKYSASIWPSLGLLIMLHNPRCFQQPPQRVGEPRGWSLWPDPVHDFVRSRLIASDVCERSTTSQNLPVGEFSISSGKGRAPTSRIVIPIA